MKLLSWQPIFLAIFCICFVIHSPSFVICPTEHNRILTCQFSDKYFTFLFERLQGIFFVLLPPTHGGHFNEFFGLFDTEFSGKVQQRWLPWFNEDFHICEWVHTYNNAGHRGRWWGQKWIPLNMKFPFFWYAKYLTANVPPPVHISAGCCKKKLCWPFAVKRRCW